MRSLSILGSTGSIGRSSLDVVEALPDRFRVVALAAGRSLERLAEQVARFRPRLVSIDSREDVSRLERLLPTGLDCRIVAGAEGLTEAATHPDADTVVGGLVGALGLRSSLEAIRAGKRLALANKEPLVVAGPLILAEAARSKAEIIPVDSEHSAIHQAMRAGRPEEAQRIVLTASGGPFRERRLDTFDAITVADALEHPTWKMGPKITIDSATMMNKGLEVIEAHFLFRLPEERIEVVIHPQSLIHSFVEFVDGSLVAQLARNDMKFPIVYALSYPERLPNAFGRLDLVALARLDFVPVEPRRYPALGLAREALRAGGGMPAVLNAANEEVVAAFVAGRLSFPAITDVLGQVLDAADGWTKDPDTVSDVLAAEEWARAYARGAARTAAAAAVADTGPQRPARPGVAR